MRERLSIADVRDAVPETKVAGSAPAIADLGRKTLGVLTHLIAA
jgi:hypothetical protein